MGGRVAKSNFGMESSQMRRRFEFHRNVTGLVLLGNRPVGRRYFGFRCKNIDASNTGGAQLSYCQGVALIVICGVLTNAHTSSPQTVCA